MRIHYCQTEGGGGTFRFHFIDTDVYAVTRNTCMFSFLMSSPSCQCLNHVTTVGSAQDVNIPHLFSFYVQAFVYLASDFTYFRFNQTDFRHYKPELRTVLT
jgi:predicted membrane-bound dolichyl-phosphate-mannose-protein mannosyltransferase